MNSRFEIFIQLLINEWKNIFFADRIGDIWFNLNERFDYTCPNSDKHKLNISKDGKWYECDECKIKINKEFYDEAVAAKKSPQLTDKKEYFQIKKDLKDKYEGHIIVDLKNTKKIMKNDLKSKQSDFDEAVKQNSRKIYSNEETQKRMLLGKDYIRCPLCLNEEFYENASGEIFCLKCHAMMNHVTLETFPGPSGHMACPKCGNGPFRWRKEDRKFECTKCKSVFNERDMEVRK